MARQWLARCSALKRGSTLNLLVASRRAATGADAAHELLAFLGALKRLTRHAASVGETNHCGTPTRLGGDRGKGCAGDHGHAEYALPGRPHANGAGYGGGGTGAQLPGVAHGGSAAAINRRRRRARAALERAGVSMFGQGIRRLEVFETASDEGVLVQYVGDKKAWGWHSYARSSVGSGISSV